ncbi:SdpI family protein [bacterium]|nr:SdpI family protein [bacterium]
MKFKKTDIIIISLISLSFIVGIYLYPQMPEKMASHWNVKGEVDGYLSKFWGIFLMPIVSLGLFLLFLLIPRIDPLKANIEKFRKYFDSFIVLIMVFLFYIYLLGIVWNLGKRFNMGRTMVPALGVLFYYCGILIENAKRNWFIGIRTPWTLSSESVWDKTHKIGGKLFKVAGLIAFLGIFFPNFAFYLILVPVLLAAFYTIAYSYFEYQKETKR